MLKKQISLAVLVLMQVSSVLGVGYRQAVNRTLSPGGVEEVMMLYEMMGWHVAGFLILPLLGMLAYGWYLSEWKRDNFWALLILGFLIGIGVVALFPFSFLYL